MILSEKLKKSNLLYLIYCLDNSALFKLEIQSNELKVVLDRVITENDVHGKKILMATIVARRGSTDLESIVLLINVPLLAVTPEFSQSLYQGSINNQKEFEIEQIFLVNGTFGPDVTFELPIGVGI